MLPFFEISTNGQYDDRKATFLGNYFSKVILSLDGPEEIQNRHRPVKIRGGSFKRAISTAEIISNSQADLCLRSCISNLNVNMMEQITHWFCETLDPLAINFEVLCPTSVTKSSHLFPPDPFEFARNLIRAREVAKKSGVQVVYASDISRDVVLSSCPVGKDAAIFTPDGKISSCYLMPERWENVGLELSFGFINDPGKVKINNQTVESIRKMVIEKPRCLRCFCRWSCAGGCHVGNTFPGSSLAYNDFCIQTRIISSCTLLSSLGLHEMTEEILQDKQSMFKLALNHSDLLCDFEP